MSFIELSPSARWMRFLPERDSVGIRDSKDTAGDRPGYSADWIVEGVHYVLLPAAVWLLLPNHSLHDLLRGVNWVLGHTLPSTLALAMQFRVDVVIGPQATSSTQSVCPISFFSTLHWPPD